MASMDPALIALIATLFGGAGVKMVEHWFGKSKVKIDEATQMREELRVEISAQKDKIKDLENKLEQYKREYYDLRDQLASLKTEYTILLNSKKFDISNKQSP